MCTRDKIVNNHKKVVKRHEIQTFIDSIACPHHLLQPLLSGCRLRREQNRRAFRYDRRDQSGRDQRNRVSPRRQRQVRTIRRRLRPQHGDFLVGLHVRLYRRHRCGRRSHEASRLQRGYEQVEQSGLPRQRARSGGEQPRIVNLQQRGYRIHVQAHRATYHDHRRLLQVFGAVVGQERRSRRFRR